MTEFINTADFVSLEIAGCHFSEENPFEVERSLFRREVQFWGVYGRADAGHGFLELSHIADFERYVEALAFAVEIAEGKPIEDITEYLQ